ncbi:hypothetical protein [Pseudomonas koreensis]|uniref:hypothetical protein n=1 Tax=Pseudomonas koreensis TaxID=198620 RepID=UPI0014729D52|nr:hypothetical protein [Pseudomonas koreensis]NNA55628.1 hypothetical protein [Pseudomonas koreensis]
MEVLEVVSGVIISIGGGAAIIGGFSNWLGKVWADRLMEQEKSRFAKELEHEKSKLSWELEQLKNSILRETESFKIQLKKSEYIFEKEFEAACEFSALLQRLLPKHRHFLDAENEWLEDLTKVEQRSIDIENELSAFLINYGAILDNIIKKEISQSIASAIDLRFSADVLSDSFAGTDTHLIYSKLKEIEQNIIMKFRTQSMI